MHDIYSKYKSVEVAILNTATKTVDISSTTDTSSTLNYGTTWLIRTDQTVTMKFNTSSDDAITLTAAEGSIEIQNLLAKILLITNNSGSTANVKVLVLGKST